MTRRDVWVSMLLYPRHTLPTAAAPVIVASGLAAHDRVLALLPALACFLAGWLIQLGGVITDNYNNMVRHGEDDPEHAAFVRALRAGVVTLQQLRWAIYACYLTAAAPGLYLLYLGGLPALVIGLTSIAASLIYSTGPFPLGDNGFGDMLFFIFFGIVSVVGTYYVQAASVLGSPLPFGIAAGTVTAAAFVASLPVAALTTNILVIDNIRDLEFDRAKGERTLAVMIGASWTRVEYVALLVLAYLAPAWFCLFAGFKAWTVLPLLSIPYGALVARRVIRLQTYQELIPMTPQAGQVLLAHSILAAVGFALGD